MYKTIYTTSATATTGRNGHARSADGLLDVPLAFPTELGGSGKATNPEQLFAAGYAACFAQSIQVVASRHNFRPANLNVTATVDLLLGDPDYSIGVRLNVQADAPVPRNIIDEAHQVCAYSSILRGNGRVEIDA